MNRQAVQLILVAALVAIAGCAGGMGGTPESDSPTDDSSTTDSSDGGMGTAAFYVSDDPSVIDDFQHLNVTITKVGFKRTGDLSDGDSNETDRSGNETDGDDGNESDDGSESTNETATETDDSNESTNETDGETDDDASDEHWVEHDVDNRTVDLTELKGANASMIDEFELPAGDYEKVFIYVSDTEGILTDGSETKVKLPSNRLQINSKFTIGDGERVDFVYDIAPHKAGNSGKYILKPVISQSGTGDDVEIRDIDTEKDDGEDGDKQRGNGNDGEKQAEAA
ncbi:hypothetical protein CP556_08005 [Natrinema sp. CBA1119]|uniref:DUF4382 domain-containing protein n=1 Tax=Natrinema sp. CBA1119 TaxID=1608465 RepID=UPI000BF87E40|nr:DUF4382 domain-containing protein [Natrinema sp. CBA1119]PGF16065.1 hypothetical protein CP556_08005 [Natrinema sp. CBA1119]